MSNIWGSCENSSLWGGKDYLDQQDYFSKYQDEYESRKFPKIAQKNSALPNHIIDGNPIDSIDKYENRRGI